MRGSSTVGVVVAAAVLVAGSAVLLVWSLFTAAGAWSLYQFESEDPAALVEARGTIMDVKGWGPLALDVVAVERRSADRPGSVQVYRSGDRPTAWPRPVLLVGEHGAHYAHEPKPQGVWLVHGGVAAAGLLGVALAGWAMIRRKGVFDALGRVIFGQRAHGTDPVTTVAGNGTHGLGGQVPPYVPYNPDWHPKKRIR